MKATTLCRSDLHYFSHYHDSDIHIKEPLSQWHECAGIIAHTGLTSSPSTGQKLAIKLLSRNSPEALQLPGKWVHKHPDTLSYAEGALLKPLAVAVHAVRKAAAKLGKSYVIIIGAGAIGLLCAAVAKSVGYG
ncbi:hypothetical protein B0J13DRAFT_630185 [Dactylonectria estremocensis]|uniref:Alcohol dehydrogenase-like C-terminal domain-containing protein n=1 Tax=Dactylonectria estremocensis TaxID=1079267 RepID=A0A9P9DDH0_9HYPO|nr:hypothetical protein B0J13DRAFT_630185 [Dactylonectria estremocensis]